MTDPTTADPVLSPDETGPDTWSDGELLSRLIGNAPGVRTAVDLPGWTYGLLGLTNLSEVQLAEALGLPGDGARRLAAALELHRRIQRARMPRRPKLNAPETVAEILTPWLAADHERLWCLPLDPHCCLIGDPVEVSRGDVDGTDACPRAVLRAAIRAGACSMVVAHNHPSGDPAPSAADAAVTRRLVAAARSVDIPLQDHVVVAHGGRWTSLRRDQPELFR
jgi:DNA repair protein RadC